LQLLLELREQAGSLGKDATDDDDANDDKIKD
jgi:hypothetical protein